MLWFLRSRVYSNGYLASMIPMYLKIFLNYKLLCGWNIFLYPWFLWWISIAP